MGTQNVRYVLRVIKSIQYEHVPQMNATDIGFGNGSLEHSVPGHSSDKNDFPPGTIVLCRLLKKYDPEKGRDYYSFAGMAVVEEFDEAGRPVRFGRTGTLNSLFSGAYSWVPPSASDQILDERQSKV